MALGIYMASTVATLSPHPYTPQTECDTNAPALQGPSGKGAPLRGPLNGVPLQGPFKEAPRIFKQRFSSYYGASVQCPSAWVVYFQFPKKNFKHAVSGHLRSYRHGTMPEKILLKFCSKLVYDSSCFY